jgi:hypothetical protein
VKEKGRMNNERKGRRQQGKSQLALKFYHFEREGWFIFSRNNRNVAVEIMGSLETFEPEGKTVYFSLGASGNRRLR